jgi:anti-sigma B factor antagonist
VAGADDGLRRPPVKGIETHDGAVVVRLAGEIDIYNSDDVRAALDEVTETGPQRLVVDLTDVGFMDSTALGVLIQARSRLENRALLLAAPSAEIKRMLEVSGIDRHIPVHATVEDALAAPL